MAIFHLHVKNISRAEGRSAVAAAAYRAGATLFNEAEERESAFGGRRNVIYAEIRAPNGAPAWCFDRASLWNGVEAAEKRVDARLAKEITFAIPRELPAALWLVVAREMADAYAALGHVADFAIHDDGDGHNPHVHIMLTTRVLADNKFGLKIRAADNHAFVVQARALWEKIANDALVKAGSGVEIDARSHFERGIDAEPTQHRGADRQERHARRAAVRDKGAPMLEDTIEARRELLVDKQALERFPLLRARGDWPPDSSTPPSGLTVEERQEFKAFWQEVYRRQLDPDRDPSTITPLILPEDEPRARRAPEVVPPRVAVPVVEPRYDGALRPFETSEKAATQFAALELALAKAQQAQGRDPLTPRSADEWHDVLRASNELKATFAELRAENERNRAYTEAFREKYPLDYDSAAYPVPDPDGRPITPRERNQAEEAMISAVESPADSVQQTPRPEQVSESDRRDAEEAVLRRNKTFGRDPDLAWLEVSLTPEHQVPSQRDPELDWLRDDDVEPEREHETERERER